MRTALLSFSLLVLWAPTARAQDARVEADPSIAWVTSGGHWSDGVRDGHFRVVVRSLGWDHVVSEVTVQWLAGDAATQTYDVVRTQVVFDPAINGPWSFGEPTIEPVGGWIRVTARGTNSYTMEEGRLSFVAGALDEVIVIDEGSAGTWAAATNARSTPPRGRTRAR